MHEKTCKRLFIIFLSVDLCCKITKNNPINQKKHKKSPKPTSYIYVIKVKKIKKLATFILYFAQLSLLSLMLFAQVRMRLGNKNKNFSNFYFVFRSTFTNFAVANGK